MTHKSTLQPQRITGAKRRFRIACFAVIFNIKMEKIRAAQQWGMFASHHEQCLLECRDQHLPDSYYTMPKTLPPGWLLKSIPVGIRDQIETYAKNVIARLFTPIVKRRATQVYLKWLRLKEIEVASSKVTPKLLRDVSVLFSCVDDSSLEKLIAGSSIRVYPSTWWLHHPSRNPSNFVSGFLVLDGACQVVPRSSTKGGGLDANTPAYRYPSVLMETCSILQTPITDGIVATTKCTVLEFSPASLVSLIVGKLQLPTPTSAEVRRQSSHHDVSSSSVHQQQQHSSALRGFVIGRLIAQMQTHFSLGEHMLAATPYFKHWDLGDLKSLARNAQPRVALPGEPILLSTSGSNVVDSAIYICRGSASVTRISSGGDVEHICDLHRANLEASSHLKKSTGYFYSKSSSSVSLDRQLTLSQGDVFGVDYCILDDACQFRISAAEGTRPLEYWVIPRVAIMSLLRSTVAIRDESENASMHRVELLKRTVPLVRLCNILRQHNQLCQLPVAVLEAIALKSTPRILKVGERLCSVGDAVGSLTCITIGKLSQLTMGGAQHDHENEGRNNQREPQYFLADGTAGDGFLRQTTHRWAHSYSASRVTECWEVRREDCISLLREQGLMSILNTQRHTRESISPTRRRSPTLTSYEPDHHLNVTIGSSPEFTTDARIALRQEKRKAVAADEARAEKVAEVARRQKTNDNLPPDHIGFYQREGISTAAPNHAARLHIRKPHFVVRPPAANTTIAIRTDARHTCCGLDVLQSQRRVTRQTTDRSDAASRPLSARLAPKPPREDASSIHLRPTTARERLQASSPIFPDRGSLQKAALKEIIATHKLSVSRTREVCGKEATVDAAVTANPNGSIANARRGAYAPKVTRFGELYFERFPSSFTTEAEISLQKTIPQKLAGKTKKTKKMRATSKRASSVRASLGARSSVSDAHPAQGSDDEFNFDDVIKTMNAVQEQNAPSFRGVPKPPPRQRHKFPFNGKNSKHLPTAYLSAHGFN